MNPYNPKDGVFQMAVAVKKSLDEGITLEVLRGRGGTTDVPELVADLRKRGVPEGEARRVIWHLLALGVLEFNSEMNVRISHAPASREAR
jgi:hypothetical protein